MVAYLVLFHTKREEVLTELDFVGNFVRETNTAKGENNFGRQLLVAREAAASGRLTHCLFDFTLRGDADIS